MGAFLDKPITEKHTDYGIGNNMRYSLSSMQGWRMEMEDAHCVKVSLPGSFQSWSFFSVFDGHAGGFMSEQCAAKLLDTIISADDFRRLTLESPEHLYINAIRNGFLEFDRLQFQLLNDENSADRSGSTAVCAFVTPRHIVIANCGDSRAILVRDGQVIFSTVDHKPVNPIERERIVKAGGTVMIQRVNGSLAVSRALGDFDYKRVEGRSAIEQLVSPEPEITFIPRSGSDEYILLACDGIWDVLSNDQVNTFLQHRLRATDDLKKIANEILDLCLYKGSRDNMSVILVTFANAPSVDASIAEKDKKLDEDINHFVVHHLNAHKNESVELEGVLDALLKLDLTDYPPGGLITKRYIVDNLVQQHNSQFVDHMQLK